MLWIPLVALSVAVAIRTIVLDRRMHAHLRYLQQAVRDLGGEDRFNVRCSHCGKRMRGAPSVRQSTTTASGSGWEVREEGVFHLDRPACAAAADAATAGVVR